MKRIIHDIAVAAMGASIAGAVVGVGEALYRSASVGYAAFLYAALCAVGGLTVGVALRFFSNKRRPPPFRTGFLLAWFALVVVIGQFILKRDIFLEAPGSAPKAALVALVCGLLVTLLIGLTLWTGAHRLAFRADSKLAGVWLAGIAALGLVTSVPEDRFPSLAAEPPQSEARGVIMVVADTLRADALGPYGATLFNGVSVTPNIDRFAGESALFLDMSAQASWTKPTMASVMTSRHVSGHRTMSKTAVLPGSLPTLASALQDAGVRTSAVVTNYNLESGFGFARGFDDFHYLAPARYFGAPARANRLVAYNVIRLIREKKFTNLREARYFYRSGEEVNAVGLSMLDTLGEDPFFMWLHYMEPHDPYFAKDGGSFARVSDPHPPADWADAMRAAYRDDVARFDDAFGTLLEALDARGLRDRVTVVLTADHGEEFFDHDGYYHGVTLYEEQLRVPLIVRGPDIAPSVVGGIARQIDLAPTVLSRFGVVQPGSWEGADVFVSSEARTVSIAEEDHEGVVLQSVRHGDQKLILANPDNGRGLPERERFDLANDPGEQDPLDADKRTEEDLFAVLQRVKLDAESGSAKKEERALDSEAEAALRALGYVE